MNGNTSGIVCGNCQPDYCACTDFYRGRMAFWRGDYDALWLTNSRRRIIDAIRARLHLPQNSESQGANAGGDGSIGQTIHNGGNAA